MRRSHWNPMTQRVSKAAADPAVPQLDCQNLGDSRHQSSCVQSGMQSGAAGLVTKASSVELAGVVVYPCTGIHLVKKLPGKKRVPHLNRSETQDLRWGWGGGGGAPPPPHLTMKHFRRIRCRRPPPPPPPLRWLRVGLGGGGGAPPPTTFRSPPPPPTRSPPPHPKVLPRPPQSPCSEGLWYFAEVVLNRASLYLNFVCDTGFQRGKQGG